MISRITIQNFQCHEKLRIDFDERVTTIVGESDVGKSGVIRALRWLCQNQPSGESFVRHGTKGTTVQIQADGKTIKRRRGSSVNEYHLDGEVYKSFGSAVPPTVADVLDVGPVNFQQQHDASFWFALTPGEVSRQLNAVVDLEIIDSSLAEIGKRNRKAGMAAEIAAERLADAELEAEKWGWAERADEDLAEVERLESDHRATSCRMVCVRGMVGNAKRIGLTVERASGVARDAVGVLSVGRAALTSGRTRDGLAALLDRVETIRCDVNKCPPSIDVLDSAVTKWKMVEGKRRNVAKLLQRITKQEDESCRMNKTAERAEEELKEAMRGGCPVCGRPMNL